MKKYYFISLIKLYLPLFYRYSKLMIKLNIPLSWITPAGMKITQHYLKTKKSSIAIRFAGKLKKWFLRMDR